MDIHDALIVLTRRWWLVVGLPVAVVSISALTASPRPEIYEARLSFAVDVPRSALVAGSDEGTAAKVGEALIDDISRIIPGTAFAKALRRRLPADVHIDAGELASDLSATDRHRIADVWARRSAAAGSGAEELAELERQLVAVANATVAELEENGKDWFARLGDDDVALYIVNDPSFRKLPESIRQRLDLPLRAVLGLVIALGLAFLWHALDPAMYTPDEVRTATGLSVLASIPRRRRLPWGRRAS